MNSGMYISTDDTCELCDSTCYKCIGPTSEDCFSCSPSRSWNDGRCVIGCDPGKYERDGQCHVCHHTCSECDDEGPDKCTKCSKDRFEMERYLFEGECRESCPEGYYHSSMGTCDPCPPNCTVCISSDRCLYCSPSYYPKDGTCVKLECGEGEVTDPDSQECITCEEGCQKCLSENPEHCILCIPGYYQLGSGCRRACPDGTFEDKFSMICDRCDDYCEICDENECYQCKEDVFLSDGMCVLTCKEGFYGDMNRDCEPCHHMCRSCGGPSFDDCDSCEDDMYLKRGECVSKSNITCPAGRFLNEQYMCEQCHSSCKSCTGEGEDECDSCENSLFLTESQTCVSTCPQETHGNQESGRCEDCSPGCLICRDAHQCLKCKTAELHLQDGKCVPECKKGFPADGVCQDCATGCASCEEEANQCLSCEQDYLRLKHTCVRQCPSSYFAKNGLCERCPVSCTECDHTGKCSECAEYFFLHEHHCLDDCPFGYFTNVEQKQCESCHGNCAECDGPDEDDCSSCKDYSAVHYNGKCLSDCPSDTYLDGTECRDCDRSCLTCSGPHPSSCLSCRAKMKVNVNGHCEFFGKCSLQTFVDEDGQCQPCHSNCLRCSGPGKNQCISCNPQHFLLNQTCVSTCPSGYYGNEDGQECVQCHVNCASCRGHHSNECLTCTAGLLLLGHSCFPACPLGFFVNGTSGTCDPCDRSCEKCSGSRSYCLSCRDEYFLLRKSGLCLLTCPPNYFSDTWDRECKRCHPTCKTCKSSGALSCTSCYEGFKMFGGICTSDCLSGQYAIAMNETCTTCDPSCTECKGPGPRNCTLCPALQRLTEDGRCLPCCETSRADLSIIPWECCQCHEMSDECIVGLNYNLFNKGPVPSGHPGLVVFTVIFVLVSLWLSIFLFLHFRERITSKPAVKSNGYAKIAEGPFTSATLSDSLPAEYCDKNEDLEDEEDDEDIVYMGKDGVVYRKFKYSMLEGEEEEEVDLEYDDEMYILT